MRNPRRLFAAAALASMVFACTGGGGSLSDGMTTWDGTPSSVERAGSTAEASPDSREGAASSREGVGTPAEPALGAQGGGSGAFDCSGRYTCADDDGDDSAVTLASAEDGACSVPVGKSKLVFAPDGSVLFGGSRVGSWEKTSEGFRVTTEDGSVTCTKVARGGEPGE